MDSNTHDILSYEAHKKSTGVAYLLWFFFGWLGVHYFYLGNTGLGITRLALSVIPVIFLILFSVFATVGNDVAAGAFLLLAIMLFIVGVVWQIAEIFLIPSLVKNHNLQVIQKIQRAGTA